MKKPATKSAKKSSAKRQQIIVLVDGAGNYYELPRATIERRRVSEPRKKEVAATLEDKPSEFQYINRADVPGSTVATPFEGGRQLHYAGHYLRSIKSKR